MNFILISKKPGFEYKQINEHILESERAPSLISREAIKYENSNFILYIYPYNHIDHEIDGYSYNLDEYGILLINGIVNVGKELRNPDIKEFFSQLKDDDQLFGDYQLVSIDKNGCGSITTPPLSVRHLFFYEDKNFTVLSTEIKLIVDGIEKFRENKFVNHYDLEFIEDAVFNEWTPRNSPENTIFKEIKRIFPYDTKYFRNGQLVIERKTSISVPQWFREAYNKDKDKLYDDYYEFLINFTESNLVNLKPNMAKISLALTGGYDSRLTLAILSNVCKKHNIPFECHTSGQSNHPDVAIAKKVAEANDIEHIHKSIKIRPNTKDYSDYASTFYISQGDFNSKDSVLVYKRKVLQLNVLEQLGMSGHKKDEMDKIYTANRWIGRRILFHKNFFFPLFFTSYEIWFALLYAEMGKNSVDDLVYEVLKRANPKLLEIPFVGKSLSQTDIKAYQTVIDSKHHEKEPFLWDYQFVRKNLKLVLNQKFDKTMGFKSKLIFKIKGLNELDFFLNPVLGNIIDMYRKKRINMKECLEMITNEEKSMDIPKTKIMITMTKESLKDPYIPKMQILMDMASAADKNAFYEIEDNLTFPNHN